MTSLTIPRVIGHRGAKAYAPENTLSSLHTAADLGIDWVEVDVKLTKDGVAVLFHDDELERCTSGSGLVRDKTWAELQELDAGSWFGESFLNERIPSLEDALNVILERGMGVNLEIKPCEGREVETAEVMLDVATRIWPEDRPPPLVSSFLHVSLETARDMMPEWPRGLLMEEHLPNWLELAQYLEAATINIDGRKATPEQIDQYLEYRKPVLAYTINDPDLAGRLFSLGISAVFSDCPDVIRDAIEGRH